MVSITSNNIYNMDCIEGLRQMGDDSVDITITSPPYNIGKSVRGNMYDEYKDDMTQDEYYDFIVSVINELIRVTKYYVFFNFQLLSNNKLSYLKIIGNLHENIKDIIMWHKKNVCPASQSTCLYNAYEFVVVFSKKKYAEKKTFEYAFFDNKKKYGLVTNVIYGNSNSQESNELNKACFPSYFVEWFLKRFTKEGDVILDPFMGSGTVAMNCVKHNRNYIGFELSKDQCEYAENRIKKWSLQPRLNNFISKGK